MKMACVMKSSNDFTSFAIFKIFKLYILQDKGKERRSKDIKIHLNSYSDLEKKTYFV